MADSAPDRQVLPAILDRTSSLSPWLVSLGGLVLVASVFAVDWLTGPGLSLLLGYGAVTALCAFVLPRLAGMAIAAVAVAMGAVVSLAHPDAYLSSTVATVNAGLRLVFFIALARGAALLHGTIVELDLLAHTDSLSGLRNRRGFIDRAEHERRMATRRKTPLALVAIDLDGLKRVNDERGHAAGDAMIAEFSRALAETFRSTDALARVGGDEFAALLPDTDLAGARVLLDRLTQRAAPTQFSCGVVSSQDSSWSIVALMGAADEAMYQAKGDVTGTAVVAVELPDLS